MSVATTVLVEVNAELPEDGDFWGTASWLLHHLDPRHGMRRERGLLANFMFTYGDMTHEVDVRDQDDLVKHIIFRLNAESEADAADAVRMAMQDAPVRVASITTKEVHR